MGRQVPCMEEMKNAYKIMVGNIDGRKPSIR
jgi:hypothetical protein